MQWVDDAVVLGTRRHGEGGAILELLTQERGRHLGLVRGGAGARLKPVLQPGNTVRATWRARLDEHLGNYAVEGLALRSGQIFESAQAVFGVTHVAALCRLLPERDPHPAVFPALTAILDLFAAGRSAAPAVARFEMDLLAELGFGLDLSCCALTGVGDGLVYVSPRSGRAVSREAGEPWRDRLLALPTFLLADDDGDPPLSDIEASFALTGHFFARHLLEPRGLAFAPARERFIAAVLRRQQRAAS